MNSDAGAEPTREGSWLLTQAEAPCWHRRQFLPAQGCSAPQGSGARAELWPGPTPQLTANQALPARAAAAGAEPSTQAELGPNQSPSGWVCASQSRAQPGARVGAPRSRLRHCPTCSRTGTRQPLPRRNQERGGTEEGQRDTDTKVLHTWAPAHPAQAQHKHRRSERGVSWDLARAKAD